VDEAGSGSWRLVESRWSSVSWERGDREAGSGVEREVEDRSLFEGRG